mgnify:CR=1 FL=1
MFRSKIHLKTSFRLIDTAIYDEMIEYLEQLEASSTSAATLENQSQSQQTHGQRSTEDGEGDRDPVSSASSSSPPLASPASRLLQQFKEIRESSKQGHGQGQEH